MEITSVTQLPENELNYWTIGADSGEPITQITAPAAWQEHQRLHRNNKGLQALKLINQMVVYDPNQPEIWRAKAKLHGALGHSACCILAIQTLLTLIPNDLEGLQMHALYLYCHHHHDKALSICDSVLGTYPTQADFWALKGDILHATGKQHEAEQAGKKALSIKPDCFSAQRLMNTIQNSI
jgi:tetratricopeptide (TPR) repeat protein